jgi:hypothetical protein
VFLRKKSHFSCVNEIKAVLLQAEMQKGDNWF